MIIYYKLWLFEVPLDNTEYIFCDIQGLAKNRRIPESMFSNNHNMVNYQ